MASKIRLQVGGIIIEYDGIEDFPIKDLPNLVQRVIEVGKSTGIKIEAGIPAPPKEGHGGVRHGTTSAIASKIKCASGLDLVLAASAKLHLVDDHATFTRSQILKEMQSASAYYKKSYSNNLSKYLNQLVKDGKLNEITTDTYAMQEKAVSEMEPLLA